MKRRTHIKIKQLIVITFAWLMVGFLITLIDYLSLHSHYSLGPSDDYSFQLSLALNMGAAFIGAMLGGSFLVFYINVKYNDKPYGYTVLAVSIAYVIVISFIILVLGIITSYVQTNKIIFDPESIEAFKNALFDTSRIKSILIWSIVVALTQLFLQMSNKFGSGVFWNIIRGKYNTPKDETRIFMSLDINSSTTIAEKLGDEKYHELLKDFFADITNPILDNNGEIYQYVGDEVIIAWNYGDGISNNQCVNCFFDMKLHLEKKKEKYLKRYGIIPSFKAGIHSGKVVVGEIGIIKRDITYSGDVMNTTSRIRNMCKEFGVEVIASSDLLKELSLNNFVTQQLGSIKLRGKKKEVLLAALLPVPAKEKIDLSKILYN